MNQLIAFFLPSIIGLIQYNKFFEESKEFRINIQRYLECVLFTNTFSFAITIYIFKQPDFVFTNQFTLKYILLSTVLIYFYPIIKKFLSNTIRIKFKVKKNEKQN